MIINTDRANVRKGNRVNEDKKSFVMYCDSLEVVEMLTDEQAGQLFKAILCYKSDLELPDLDGMTRVAFASIKSYLDRDHKKYMAICEKRRMAGKLGGASKGNKNAKKKKKVPIMPEVKADPEEEAIAMNEEPAKETKSRQFKPPTVDEVRTYCQARQNDIDPEQFIDYYAARGWELTKGRKMKDWKSAVHTWEHNDKKWLDGQKAKKGVSASGSEQRKHYEQFI